MSGRPSDVASRLAKSTCTKFAEAFKGPDLQLVQLVRKRNTCLYDALLEVGGWGAQEQQKEKKNSSPARIRLPADPARPTA